MRFALAVVISALAVGAQADGIYKWVDENGVVHYGSHPPQKENVEVIKKPKSERYKQWQASLAPEQSAAEPPTEKQQKAAPEPEAQQAPQPNEALTKAQQAVRAQRCRIAQTDLQELTTHSRVREVGPDGSMRVLTEEERQERIARARQMIRDNC